MMKKVEVFFYYTYTRKFEEMKMEKISTSFSTMAYEGNEKVFEFIFQWDPRLNLIEFFDEYVTFWVKNEIEHLL